MRRFVFLLAALLVAALHPTGTALGQQAREARPVASFADLVASGNLWPGQRARISYIDADLGDVREADGRLLNIVESTLLLDRTTEATLSLREDQVLRIERRGDPVGDGAVSGAGAGAAAGLILGSACGDDFLCPGAAFALVTAPAGALLGMLLDAVNPASVVVYERDPGSTGRAAAAGAPRSRAVRTTASWHSGPASPQGRPTAAAAGSLGAGVSRLYLQGFYMVDQPGDSLTTSLRQNGLAGQTCFLFGCVGNPRQGEAGSWGAIVGYRMSRRLDVGAAALESDLGSVTGAAGGHQLSMQAGVRGLAGLAIARPSERLRLGAGPALYQSRIMQTDGAVPASSNAMGVGGLAFVSFDVLRRPGVAIGLQGQYRWIPGEITGAFTTSPSATYFGRDNAFAARSVSVDGDLSHLSLGLALRIGS